jgi:hypothetical protein
MREEQSTFDWRRYGHWDSSTEKARLCAFLLWSTQDQDRLGALIGDGSYNNGDAGLALWEGFRRESAVALELIVKAVVAKRLELRRAPTSDRVPATHDLPALWAAAGLPALPREDQYRLLLFKSVLLWSGRYATPRSAKAWAEENAALRTLDNPAVRVGKLRFSKPTTYDWDDFDRLYQTAKARLLSLERESAASHGSEM